MVGNLDRRSRCCGTSASARRAQTSRPRSVCVAVLVSQSERCGAWASARQIDRKSEGYRAIVKVGDKATPVLAVIGAFTGACNVTIDIQCHLGILK